MKNKLQKILQNATRHAFLLTFFSLPHKYESIEVNGYHLVRQFNANLQRWEVAIYSPESWKKVAEYRQKISGSQQSLIPVDDSTGEPNTELTP